MGYLRVEGVFQVLQDGACGNDTALQVVHAKAFQRLHIEMLEELLMGGLFGKHPVVHLVGTQPCAKVALEVMAVLTVVEHLLGLEIAHELLHVVVGALAGEEFACRDVEERDATCRLAEMDGTEEVVLLVVEHIVLHGDTWRHQFGDATLDELLRQLRVFQLVADGHPFAGTDELRQIGVQRMVRETGHLVALVIAVIPMGQRDAQYLRSDDGIIAVGLVEVAATKQQQRLRVFCLEVEELFHHGRQLAVFLCHNSCKGTKKNSVKRLSCKKVFRRMKKVVTTL